MRSLTITVDDEVADIIASIGYRQQTSDEDAAVYLINRTLFGMVKRVEIPAQDYRPPSVMVMIDDNADNYLKHFRCPNCGNVAFDYCGDAKLVMSGQYNQHATAFVDGEEVTESEFGNPTMIVCAGRVMVSQPTGRLVRTRCGTKLYKLKG